MAKTERKHFENPDEVREFPKGRMELVQIGGVTIGRAVLEPGWRWATSVQPIAKTKSCEAPHFQYHVSGVLRITAPVDFGITYLAELVAAFTAQHPDVRVDVVFGGCPP